MNDKEANEEVTCPACRNTNLRTGCRTCLGDGVVLRWIARALIKGEVE
jgi:hypothetical protein